MQKAQRALEINQETQASEKAFNAWKQTEKLVPRCAKIGERETHSDSQHNNTLAAVILGMEGASQLQRREGREEERKK